MAQDFEKNKKAKVDNVPVSGKKLRNGNIYKNDSFEDDSDDSENEMFDDPDWQQTPLIKRLKKIKDTNNQTLANKRKLGETFTEGEVEAGTDGIGEPRAKRSSVSGVCGCKNGCKTKRCSCVKAGNY